MFSSMFAMPQPRYLAKVEEGERSEVEVECGSEAHPIMIHNVSEPAFDIFVSQAYGK
jgi:hypothetical protein